VLPTAGNTLLAQGQEEDFRLLAMKTEVIRRRLHTFASENHPQNAKEWLSRTSATLRSSLWYEKEASHIRPSVIPMSRSSVCGLSADSEIAQAIWLSMDGTFASHQPM
jgi:hypothetical protein